MQGQIFKMSERPREWPNQISGIYKLSCRTSGKIYVGYSVDFKRRWSLHRTQLRNQSHSNIHMQRVYNKYGEDNFTFEVVELCDEPILKIREWHWMQEFNVLENGFNIKGYQEIDGDLACEGLGRDFQLVNPEGDIVEGNNLTKFARQNKLIASCLHNVLTGKYISHKGYRLVSNETVNQKVFVPKSRSSFKKDEKIIISPQREEFRFTDIKEFSLRAGINPSCLVRVLRGRAIHIHGWHRPDLSENEKAEVDSYLERRYPKNIVFIDPNGNLVEVGDLFEFCRSRQFRPEVFHKLINKQKRSYLGWRLASE